MVCAVDLNIYGTSARRMSWKVRGFEKRDAKAEILALKRVNP